MKILFLGLADSPVLDFLRREGNEVAQTMDKLDAAELSSQSYDFLVSYRYRLILKDDVLSLFPDRVVNLHPSLLPWNRGTFSNFWSFLEGTPKGVTVHYIDLGVDTGDLIAQERIRLPVEGETLRTTYDKTHEYLVRLFYAHWPAIKTGNCSRQVQQGEGTIHRIKEKEEYDHLLEKAGWDTPVTELVAYGKARGLYRGLDESA